MFRKRMNKGFDPEANNMQKRAENIMDELDFFEDMLSNLSLEKLAKKKDKGEYMYNNQNNFKRDREEKIKDIARELKSLEDMLSNLSLEKLAGKKDEKEYMYKKYENKEKFEKDESDKTIAIFIKECDLNKEECPTCGLKFNVIKNYPEDKKVSFEIALPGFGKEHIIARALRTKRDKYGNKLAKVVRLKMDRRDFSFNGIEEDPLFIQQIPNYLDVEFAFFGAKRIDKVSLNNGLLQILVRY